MKRKNFQIKELVAILGHHLVRLARQARLFQRLEFGNLVLRMRSKMSSYVNCAQFCEGFFHSMDAIFQLFSYFPCKLDVLVLVVIFKKEYQEVF